MIPVTNSQKKICLFRESRSVGSPSFCCVRPFVYDFHSPSYLSMSFGAVRIGFGAGVQASGCADLWPIYFFTDYFISEKLLQWGIVTLYAHIHIYI